MAVHAESSIQLNTIPAYTSLLGGHFYYKSTEATQEHPTRPSANIIEIASTPSNPSTWGYNTHIGANGIKLRYNEIDLSSWTNSGLAFYNPSASSQGQKMMELTGNGLFLYRPLESGAQGPPSIAAQLTTTGLNIAAGSITLGNSFAVTNEGAITSTSGTIGGWYLGDNFLSTDDDGSPDSGVITLSQGIHLSPLPSGQEVNGVLPANETWAFTVSNQFGVTTDGTLYANGALISGVLSGGTIDEIDARLDTLGDTITNQAIAINKIQTICVEETFYIPTQDIEIVANKNYYTRSGAGTEQDPYIYTQVITPVITDISIYYEESPKITGIILSKGDYQLSITSDSLTFQNQGINSAYLSNQALNISSVEITSDLTLGPFKWVISTNRLTLMRG